jgi:hypothetical protein
MEIIGHKVLQTYFETLMTSGNLAHAYIFAGPEHVGKTTLVNTSIQKLVGDSAHIDLEKGYEQSYPDLYYLEPEEGKKDISVKQVRVLTSKLHMTSFSNGWRIVVIQGAQKLNQASSNALLKMLEEPGDKTVFFLITHDISRMLPTILSRCVTIQCKPVSYTTLEDALTPHMTDWNRSDRISLIRLAQGRPGVALHYLRNKEEFDTMKGHVQQLVQALGKGVPDRFSLLHDEQIPVERYLLEVLHDCMHIQSNTPEQVMHFYAFDALQSLAARVHPVTLQRSLEYSVTMRDTPNLNTQLYLENILAHL